jgi:hypothetical protein
MRPPVAPAAKVSALKRFSSTGCNVTDYFAIFGERPRPWLDEALLKSKFLEQSQLKHPDRQGAEPTETPDAFTLLNSAYQTLRDPRERLAHLFELVTGQKPGGVQNVPAATLDVFMRVSQLCRDASKFIEEQSKLTSPMLKAARYGEGLAWVDKVQVLQETLGKARGNLNERIIRLDAHWDSSDHAQIKELQELHLSYSYLGRWESQLQEKLMQLSF